MTTLLPGGRTVVRTLVSLKVTLLRNGLRRSPQRKAGFVLGALVSLFVTLAISLAVAALHGRAGGADAAVLLAAALTIGWAALPLFLFSGDESADPTRLTMLPLRPRPLLLGTLLAALVGPGPLFGLLVLAGGAVAGASGIGSALVAVVAVPLTLLTLVTLSRAVAAGNARMLSSRRGKDLAIFGGLLFAVLIQIANLTFQTVLKHSGSGSRLDLGPLHPYAAVLRWIPPISALDAVRSAGDGAWGAAAGQLAATLGLLALLLGWWQRSLRGLMVTADASTQITTRTTRTTRAWSLLPEGRLGAAAQRHLRYAWREPRAKAAIFTSIGMTVVFAVLSVVQGWATVYLLVFAGMMLGLQTVNLFGMDGSAFWNVAATIATVRDSRAELRGRALAVLTFAVPVVAVLGAGLAVVTGDWTGLAPALGLTLTALGGGVGLGSLLSVQQPYAMPADAPTRGAAPGQGGVVLLNAFGSMLGVALLSLPMGAILLALTVTDAPTWPLLLIGPLYGTLLAHLGLHLAANRLPGRLPEILATVTER